MLESLPKDDDRAFAKLQIRMIGDRDQEGVLYLRNLPEQFPLSRDTSLWSRMVMSCRSKLPIRPHDPVNDDRHFLETMTRQQQVMELN